MYPIGYQIKLERKCDMKKCILMTENDEKGTTTKSVQFKTSSEYFDFIKHESRFVIIYEEREKIAMMKDCDTPYIGEERRINTITFNKKIMMLNFLKSLYNQSEITIIRVIENGKECWWKFKTDILTGVIMT